MLGDFNVEQQWNTDDNDYGRDKITVIDYFHLFIL